MTLSAAKIIPAIFISFFIFASPPLRAQNRDDANFHGAAYQPDEKNRFDFRAVSTLSGFDLMVSRGRWRGVNAADVLMELSRYDGVKGSPALREIWRNILLGDFTGLKIKDGYQQSILMAERLRLLNRLGFFDEAVRLYLQASQQKPIPQAIALQGIDALALSGSADGACLEVLMARRYLQSDIWNQHAALCSAYFGETERAQEYYTQVADTSGSGFRAVYKMLSSDKTKTIQLDIPPLWRALLLAKGASVSRQALDKSDGMTAASLALNDKIPFATRLAAADKAANDGAIGPEKLRKLYELKNKTPETVSAFVEPARNGQQLSQADLYGAARFTFEGNARAAIVRTALRQLRPMTHIKGHVYAWIVDKLTLQLEVNKMPWFTPYGFALMTETNRRASAEMYYEAGGLEQSPLAIVHAVGEQSLWPLPEQELWLNAMEKNGKSDKVVASYQIARAFDQENKLGVAQQSIIQSDPLKLTGVLNDSIRKGGRGLTLVTAINKLAIPAKMSKMDLPELYEIISVLGKQGLFGERKKIALETLLQIVL